MKCSRDQLEAVNALSVRAEQAQEDFAAGKRSDLETVVEQTREADAAVRMVVQVRNQLLEAIEEINKSGRNADESLTTSGRRPGGAALIVSHRSARSPHGDNR